jgi:hypothetical protein
MSLKWTLHSCMIDIHTVDARVALSANTNTLRPQGCHLLCEFAERWHSNLQDIFTEIIRAGTCIYLVKIYERVLSIEQRIESTLIVHQSKLY